MKMVVVMVRQMVAENKLPWWLMEMAPLDLMVAELRRVDGGRGCHG